MYPGDSSTFLIKLAAQEQRVLELREELEKAQHELKEARRSAEEVAWRPDDVRASYNRSDSSSLRAEILTSVKAAGSEGKRRSLRNLRKTQRKVFSGSRHARTLSLLSQGGAPQTSLDQPLPEYTSQKSYVEQRENPTSDKTLNPNPSRPSAYVQLYKSKTGQPEEANIGTGKQLVGDLREGLWNFVEDLRQATMGEEASSNPD
ncbi:MAG: hypothetical protein Q9219_006118 [cf. Caloplaca sp. 3 TL-2023]